MMDNDDQQIGRVLSRREVLALFGAAGASVLVGCGPAQQSASGATSAPATAAPATSAPATVVSATAAPVTSAPTVVPSAVAATSAPIAVPACVVRPEVTEGPYYVAEELNRSDVRSDPSGGPARVGAPLLLRFNVSQIGASGCTPLQGAKVEIWHCDAEGQYSDVVDRGFSTKGQQWLRGYQITDANGVASFTTIYPGWYRGRAVHIHFKVHPTSTTVFTSQIFFDDAFSDQVFTAAPYAAKGQRDQLNSTDGIYKPELLVSAAKTATGYAATFDIGVQA